MVRDLRVARHGIGGRATTGKPRNSHMAVWLFGEFPTTVPGSLGRGPYLTRGPTMVHLRHEKRAGSNPPFAILTYLRMSLTQP